MAIEAIPVTDAIIKIKVAGELDATNASELADVLRPLQDGEPHYVIMATAHLEFCDVAGLWTLAAAHRGLQAEGGSLAIAEPQPQLRRLLGLAEKIGAGGLRSYPTLGQAYAAYQYPDAVPQAPVARHQPRLRALRGPDQRSGAAGVTGQRQAARARHPARCGR